MYVSQMKIRAQTRRRPKTCFHKKKAQILTSVECGVLNQIAQSFAANPLNAELNPICHLLALLGAHYILHVSRVRVKVKKSDVC